MTSSRHDLERRLDGLEQEAEPNNSILVAYRNPRTGELEDSDGKPIDEDDVSGVLVVIEETLVMTREQAERETREILGAAETAAEDAVRVTYG